MTKLTYAEMLRGLNDLTVSELTELNRDLIAIAKAKQRGDRMIAAAAQISKWKRGDVIEFFKSGRGRKAGQNFFVFEHYNRAGDSLQGSACDKDGNVPIGSTRWTVTVTQPTLKLVMRDGKKV